tara:strand:+ start:1557 stop:2060 length:504 start_codon:yes stop_codon:yes gene_type:complete
MSNYEVMGNLKKVMDYSKDGKPNWYAIINDSDDKDHRAYSPQDLSVFNNELSDPNAVVLVDVKGETAIHRSGKNEGQPYIKNATITRMGDEQVVQVPDKSGLSREEAILLTGIFTRGVTSTKSADDLDAYANRALQYFRNKVAHKVAQTPQNNVNKGVNNEPFNNQF